MNREIRLKNLKKQLINSLPKDAFKTQQNQLAWAVLYPPLILFLSISIYSTQHITLKIILSFLLGNIWASFNFYTHELLHGSITKNKIIQYFFGFLGFSNFALSPALWKSWHNQLHHPKTNIDGVDPDSYGLKDTFFKYPMAKNLYKQSPGSGFFSSYFFLPTRFTNQCLSVLWYMTFKKPELFPNLNRGQAIMESLLLYAFWIGLAIRIGLLNSLCIIIIPMLIANTLVMSYIATQHFLSPLTDFNDPLENTISVKTWKFFQIFHHNFGLHTEHHLFPSLNNKFLPILSDKLKELEPNRYIKAPHLFAIKMLYKTPRVYKNKNILINPMNHQEVKINEIREKLLQATS